MTPMAQRFLIPLDPPYRTIPLEEYRRRGGYVAVTDLLEKEKYSPAEVKQMVLDSGLRGMGGAGFPTGRKWNFLPEDAPHPRYLIVNTDEMESGTFKDRILITVNPHTVIEGMIIASYAVSAHKGFLFIRPSYEGAAEIFHQALKEARDAGLLGKNILGSGHSFNIVSHRSAGRYICGEAKGLVHALMGMRPHPNIDGHLTSGGLWGAPTIVNNAETLGSIPHLIRNGPAWFKNLARSKGGAGTKIYCISGRVKKPGAYELPMGTPLREIIEEHGGGMREGYQFKTCMPGGASTRFVPPGFLDVEMDFSALPKQIGPGHRHGTGSIMVFDQTTCLVGAVLNLMNYFVRESCGWCTPCREGLPYIRELLRRIEDGEGKEEFVPIIRRMSEQMHHAYCEFAPGAAAPVLGLLDGFMEEVREHIIQKKCPFKKG
jgi:NADH-quinone oxidoreductase subunit F